MHYANGLPNPFDSCRTSASYTVAVGVKLCTQTTIGRDDRFRKGGGQTLRTQVNHTSLPRIMYQGALRLKLSSIVGLWSAH